MATAAAFRSIVLGLELDPTGRHLSEGSRHALRKVEILAAHYRGPVTIVHATADDEIWDPEQSAYIRRPALSEEGRAALEAAAAGLREWSSEVRLEITAEHAVVAMESQVEATGADLVVVARRSMPSRDRRTLGSVARSLIQHSRCAVWVVRTTGGADGCVLAGSDLGPVGERVVRTAAEVAPLLGTELHVVHALGMPLSVQMSAESDQMRWLRESCAEADARIREWAGDTKTVTHVGVTSPTQALLEGVERLAPRLLVIGSVARSGLPRFVLGNTAKRLLDRVETSLLVLKPE